MDNKEKESKTNQKYWLAIAITLGVATVAFIIRTALMQIYPCSCGATGMPCSCSRPGNYVGIYNVLGIIQNISIVISIMFLAYVLFFNAGETKKEKESKTNKKYWLIPTISYGISIILITLPFLNVEFGSIIAIPFFIFSIIGIISSLFIKQKYWKYTGVCFLLWIIIVAIRAIITGVIHSECITYGSMSYGGMNSINHYNDYSGLCKIFDVLSNTILAIIQFTFLILGTIGFARAVYLSVKKDKN